MTTIKGVGGMGRPTAPQPLIVDVESLNQWPA